MTALLSWSAWALAVTVGSCVFVARSAETGLAYVNLPRFLYFLWVLVCVLLLSVLREPAAAAAALILAAAVGVRAIIGDEAAPGGRAAEVLERVAGCRRALEADARNPASLELLGDVYSTLEDGPLALKYWGLAYAIWPQAKLLEKIECVKRPDPVFHVWGSPCVRELRACPACERVGPRLEFACPRCGEAFFPGRAGWAAARFNRAYEANGAGAAVETGLAFLPFLYFCAPWAYALAWLVWIGARRPGPEAAA
ncbi:MAG: hypothetical protein HYV14_10335 [Elusimicrobia bacterium]|nr:hypothetical protein [Elusimicrobiota bacterium]